MIILYGTGQIVQLDSFYVTDSPLSVTTIAKLAMFYLNWPVLVIITYGTCQTVQLDSFYVTDSPLSVTNRRTGKVLFKLTVSMSHIVP